ncbi:hypothetical protein K04M5_35620 [Vibrio alginolyticus]|nr:hypothetical protein K04M5_35620 [Vibrio alginolyticus]
MRSMSYLSCVLTAEKQKGEAKVERPMLSQQDIFTARKEVLDIHMAETIEQYIVRLVMATRQANEYDTELDKWLSMGVSPRATIALDRCARAHAWLAGRDFVSPEDVQTMAYPVLRHRLLLSYQAEGITANQVIDKLLNLVGSA